MASMSTSPTLTRGPLPFSSPASPPTSPRLGRFPVSLTASSSSLPLSSRTSSSSEQCFPEIEELPYLDFRPVTLERVKHIILGSDGEHSAAHGKVRAVRLVTLSPLSPFPIGIKPGQGLNIDRGVSPGEMYLSLLYMHLAYSCYAVLGNEIVTTPKSYLRFESNNDGDASSAIQSVTSATSTEFNGIESLHLQFSSIHGYHDFLSANTKDKNGCVFSFIEFIKKYRRPPEKLLTPEGTLVPLKGVVGFLALARVLADIAPIGNDGRNAGFVWVKDDHGVITAAQTTHAVPSVQTARTAVSRSRRFFHFRIDTNRAYDMYDKDGRMSVRAHHLKNPGIKDLQICETDDGLKISWINLSRNQKEEFLQVLIHISRFFKSSEIQNFLFEREGALYPPDMSDSLKDQVSQLKGRVSSWLEMQFNIYHEELNALETNYSTSVKIARKMDTIGELPPGQSEEVIKMIYQSILQEQQLLERDHEIKELKKALEASQHFLDDEAKKVQWMQDQLRGMQDQLRVEKEAHQALRESWMKLEKQTDLTDAIREINGDTVKSEGPNRSIFRRSSRTKLPSEVSKTE